MPGCSVHTYLIVPALSGVNSNDPPLPKLSDLKSAPESAVTLWSTESSLTHLTFSPTLTVVSLGANWMFCLLISTSPLALDDAGALVAVEPPPLSSPPPHPAATSARVAPRARRIRLMPPRTPPRRHPSTARRRREPGSGRTACRDRACAPGC